MCYFSDTFNISVCSEHLGIFHLNQSYHGKSQLLHIGLFHVVVRPLGIFQMLYDIMEYSKLLHLYNTLDYFKLLCDVVQHLGIFQFVVTIKTSLNIPSFLTTFFNIPSCCTTSWDIPNCCTCKTSWNIPSCCTMFGHHNMSLISLIQQYSYAIIFLKI